jgi:hypothetical protein
MKIIGLTGAAGSGKDTVADAMRRHFFVRRTAFADPMRLMLGALLSHVDAGPEWMTHRDLKETAIPGIGHSYRVLAQKLGTEWGRSVDPDLWVNIAKSFMLHEGAFYERDNVWCITDVRFDNEAQFIKGMGGVVWKINRQSAMPVAAHISENGINPDLVDIAINNDQTMQELEMRVLYETQAQLDRWHVLGACYGRECEAISNTKGSKP